MKRNFWIALLASFILVNEYLASWLLAIFVGDLDMQQAYARTFRFASFDSYLLTASFRAIPYIALALLAAKSKLSLSANGQSILWLMLIALAGFHLYGYWGMQYALFTPDHASSTSALAAIFIPIWALVIGSAGYALFYIVSLISQYLKRH
ncbi:MAG: hypothetical protein ACQEQ8_05305 [Pseudomonadota bacterium]